MRYARAQADYGEKRFQPDQRRLAWSGVAEIEALLTEGEMIEFSQCDD